MEEKTTSHSFITEQKLEQEKEAIEYAGQLHWFHWFVVIFSLILTITAWHITKSQINEKVATRFNREAEQVIALVSERMGKYEDALWGGVATIHSQSFGIDYHEWERFSHALELPTKYPGIRGIGVIYNISPDKLDTFLAEQRRERPDFKLHPAHDKNEFWPITYIEPLKTNAQAVGLDMAHEVNRYTAALKARDTGTAQITGPIVLVQDAGKTPGFLFYAPFYTGDTPDTLEERRKDFVGMVYAPFVVKKLMEGTLAKERRHIGIKITDQDEVIYDEHLEEEKDFDPSPLFSRSFTVDLYGRTWVFDIRSKQSFRAAAHNNKPWIILCGGLLIDSLLLALFILLSRSNRRAIHFADNVTTQLRDAVEESKKANEAKSNFLANMSHELRTPMNGIIGLSSILMEVDLPKDEKESIKTIYQSSESLLSLLNDLLDFAKIEAGELQIESIPFNLRDEILHIKNLLLPITEKKDLKLDITIDSTLPEFFEGDATRIRQVLYNLLGNAIKFTNEGQVSLHIFKPDPHQNNMIRFKIQDTGIGIAEEIQHAIFEKFSQEDVTISRRFGGTGLGLSISRKIVEIMGGAIDFKSVKGQGSVFWFDIPLETPSAYADTLQQKHPLQNLDAQMATIKNANILVVDDHPTNLLLIRKMLNKLGFEHIVECASGEEALEHYTKEKFDLILMDCHLPHISGMETTKTIRRMEQENHTHYTPVIALTADVLEETRKNCSAAGMDLYLTKPITKDKLSKAIMDALVMARGSRKDAQDITVQAQTHDPLNQNVVDLTHLRDFTDGDPEGEKEFFAIFLSQGLKNIAALEESIADHDDESWREAAHKFKGASANLGAQTLARACHAAEHCEHPTQTKKEQMLDDIQKEFTRVEQFLKTLHT